MSETKERTGAIMEPLLDVRQVARLLNQSEGWVRDHAGGHKRPYIASIKNGKSLRFRPEDIRAYVEQHLRPVDSHR